MDRKDRTPQDNAYVADEIAQIVIEFLEDLVDRVAVIFFDEGNVPIERLVFRLNVNQSYNSKVEQADMETARIRTSI
ncbi:hypothetical protein ACS0TY_011123 [Phlomoides rotata]